MTAVAYGQVTFDEAHRALIEPYIALRQATSRVAALEAEVAKLRWEATHDLLTGLLNRRGLFDQVAALDRHMPFQVVSVDANGLKAANDTHGHDAGDDLLKRLAEQLDTPGDIVARTGGDEFVLIRDVDAPALPGYCEAFASGATVWCPFMETVDSAMARADAAMYVNKRRRGAQKES